MAQMIQFKSMWYIAELLIIGVQTLAKKEHYASVKICCRFVQFIQTHQILHF